MSGPGLYPPLPEVTGYAHLLSMAPGIGPGGYGTWDRPTVAFHNVPPRSRLERRLAADREHIEKERLKQRREGYHTYVDPGTDLIAPLDPASAAFMDSKDRFNGSLEADARAQKEAAARRRAADLERKRAEMEAREASIAARNAAALVKEDEAITRLQGPAGALKAKRNQPGLPYDPICQAYYDGPAGAALRAADEEAKARATHRAAHLQSRGRSVAYDPVTGQPLYTVPLPGGGGGGAGGGHYAPPGPGGGAPPRHRQATSLW